jgi:hypothetical protein
LSITGMTPEQTFLSHYSELQGHHVYHTRIAFYSINPN